MNDRLSYYQKIGCAKQLWLYRRRYHRAAQRCILSILYEPLFSTPGWGSQTLEQYSTWGRTKPL